MAFGSGIPKSNVLSVRWLGALGCIECAGLSQMWRLRVRFKLPRALAVAVASHGLVLAPNRSPTAETVIIGEGNGQPTDCRRQAYGPAERSADRRGDGCGRAGAAARSACR